MSRLSRAEVQLRNRAKVLAAARAEFTERGFRDATIDGIADRADLTRGAVYSNFTGKRALYFAVLADLAERPAPAPVEPGQTRSQALTALAHAWLNRLTDASNPDSLIPLSSDLLPEVLADEDTRWQFAQLLKLNAILLGLALERLQPEDRQRRTDPGRLVQPEDGQPRTDSSRLVQMAAMVLTALHGAGQLTAAAPGFVQPLAVAAGCGQLADLELHDRWAPPPTGPPVRPADETWAPPPVIDVVRARPASLGPDGLFVMLGLNRLAAAEDAVRAAPPGTSVTVALVTDRPGELGPLAQLTVAELLGCLRQAFPESAWPELQLVHDESGDLAAAAGVEEIGNGLEFAVRVSDGRIVARAEGFGATYAAASAEIPTPRPARSTTPD